MQFAKYLGKAFALNLAMGLGAGLGVAAGGLFVYRADEAMQKAKKEKAATTEETA